MEGLEELVRVFNEFPVPCCKDIPAIFPCHELVDGGSCLEPAQQHCIPSAPPGVVPNDRRQARQRLEQPFPGSVLFHPYEESSQSAYRAL